MNATVVHYSAFQWTPALKTGYAKALTDILDKSGDNSAHRPRRIIRSRITDLNKQYQTIIDLFYFLESGPGGTVRSVRVSPISITSLTTSIRYRMTHYPNLTYHVIFRQLNTFQQTFDFPRTSYRLLSTRFYATLLRNHLRSMNYPISNYLIR